ncbi:DNA-binding protein [Streptomyces sp. NTH33]|uniref:SpoIIE family protein phosphatase n=1 Tax=Streptomyces sp. NTH33 TaxID=1735453 RepID=UPI000DA72AD2|nr:SpoIIE family protein phosphatase [Streptomyces sp. NTH33]PZH05444.1 DNA-binding protein [Streptomyces sp. NTH33]
MDPPGVHRTGGRPSGDVREALASVLDALRCAAYVTDEQGCIVGANVRAQQLLARPAAQLLGRDAHDLLHRGRHGERMPRTQCSMREAIHAGRTAQKAEEWFERGDGSLLRVAWTVAPCDLGDRFASLVLLHSDGAAERPERPGARLSELERLALLAETTSRLTSTLDVEEALRRLVRLVAPRLADWVVIDLITEHDEVRRVTVAHMDDGALTYREDLQGPMPPVPEESPMPLSRALRGVASALAGPETYHGPPDSGIAVEQRRLFEETGMHSAAIAPIRGLREVLGALTLGRSAQPEPFTAADITLLEDITRRAGLALDNARLYQRQRTVAETMQRHLLPQLPHGLGLEMTARYLPAPDASDVGGDWYDAFTLTDGAMALAIGDVVGHDLDAASGMAQLRNMLRAYAWSQQRPPSEIVQQLDQASVRIAEVSMATLVFARATVTDDGRCELSWTNAGHPPPLLITHDGVARYLTEGHGLLLGVVPDQARADATTVLPPGSTLLLYTDGLIESPGKSIDDGLRRLNRHAASLAHRPLESFTDQLLARARPPDNDDDVALLAVRIPPAASLADAKLLRPYGAR